MITIILGLLDWPGLARAVRSKLLALREEDFATAAVLMGASPQRVIGRHLLPSFTSHLIASLTLSIPSMILGETALSFLGLGVQPPTADWGQMVSNGRLYFPDRWWYVTFPGLAIFLSTLAFNLLGDSVQDANT